jgi:hypothetical protein
MSKLKLTTKLVNDTDQTLVVFEATSNSTKTKKKELQPRKAADVLASNSEVYDYLEESIDKNDTYKTFRVWKDQKPVLGVNTDEMIDNKEITIKYDTEKDCFTKVYKPRSETDHPSKKSRFRRVFRS